MTEISATEAARNFSDLLDRVEHHAESFRIVRHGHPVATIEPLRAANGKAVRALLARVPFDDEWARAVADARRPTVQERSWPT